jgi:hypothetical protein
MSRDTVRVSSTDVAQIASAVLAAIATLAALATVRHLGAERRIARDAFEAETQPLLTDVPRGLVHEEIDWHEASGELSRRLVDQAEVTVGTSGPEPIAHASVPVRNVGNGCARIRTVVFVLADGSEAAGRVINPVLPRGELTRASLSCGPGDDGLGVAEAIGMEYQDFAVIISYADASDRPREAARFEVANGQYPHVAARRWGTSLDSLR